MSEAKPQDGSMVKGCPMKIKYLSKAYHVSKQVTELHRVRDMIASGAGLGITIQSAYQDDTFIENIRPYVLDELDRRIAEKNEFLEALGVSLE
ncbi:hypothetical protein [Mangrovibacter yixingensis]|uniref:hypothetical protein n=1 Tax=Mangrovibacter yixingensis TaxID=1529639 RepID=UPI001CFAC6C1|nr:hypothetical protein [Mangrovibacter yixingensis]